MEDTGVNQFLLVDHGTQLDYAVNSGTWHADGFDLEKHVFTSATDGYFKVRNRGQDDTWAFSSGCNVITNYQVHDHSGVCQFGDASKPTQCGKQLLLDFSSAVTVPKLTGMWDVESAGDEWTGDN